MALSESMAGKKNTKRLPTPLIMFNRIGRARGGESILGLDFGFEMTEQHAGFAPFNPAPNSTSFKADIGKLALQ